MMSESFKMKTDDNNSEIMVKCIIKEKNKSELFKTIIFLCVFILILTTSVCNCDRAHHKRTRHSKLQQQRQHHNQSGANKLSRFHETAAKYNQQHQQQQEQNGLWPRIFNVAKYARITANATCGTTIHGREEFCRLAVELNRNRKSGNACGICDGPGSPDPSKQHPIENVISNGDETSSGGSTTSGIKWWQSPTLAQGPQYEFVTITLDLRQIFQITYVIVKAGPSPRPGTWVLERSMDGENFLPWQYYAVTDEECWDRFGIEPTPGKPKYKSATDVICTSYYSKLIPLENGEIHTSLKLDRPGANETSPEYLEFTLARYVRLRFLRLRAAVATETTSTLQQQKWFTYSEGPRARLLPASGLSEHEWHKRLYYSIRDINIGGLCVCNGHARQCVRNNVTEIFECQCEHNTCGIHCEYCCPLYNQVPYETGYRTNLNPTDFQNNHPPSQFECEPCQCFGHATECQYDSEIAINKESLDITGRYRGGGVCVNCTKFTTGINCQECVEGYYRPSNRNPDHPQPCVPCDCHPAGSTGDCLREAFLEEENVGDCICRPGYTGPRCSACADGYRGFPNCELCPCDPRGTVAGADCEGACNCKINVEGPTCSRCKSGYFALQAQNPEGCLACYCSGVSSTCESDIPVPQIFETLDEWLVTDISITSTVKPIFDTDTKFLIINNDDFAETEAYYWLAPTLYLGNKLEAYNSYLTVKLSWDVMRGDRSGKPTVGPDLILIGTNGLKIAYGDKSYTSENATFRIALTEKDWYHVPSDVKDIVTRLRRTEYRGDWVTRAQFLSVLSDLKHILIRAKFHTDQSESALERAVLEIQPDELNLYQSMVEKCTCPTGYTGLSCETCDYGYVKMNLNFSTHVQQLQCVKCDCNGHSRSCDLETGTCQCEHNTIGEKCERCAVGYYGSYPLYGLPDDCKRCACPLEEASNNFSPSCQIDILELVDGNEATDEDRKVENYVCTQCPPGYTGDHCEICDDGYFGDPTILGSKCEPCECGGGPCDHLTGQCLKCRGNTEGWKCDRCKPGHYGDPKTANCKPCQCDSVGALSDQCDSVTGKCECRERFAGLTCGECEPGFGNVTADCVPCRCDNVGAVSAECHPVSGMCQCRPGVEGFHCDACQHLYYGLSEEGCKNLNNLKNYYHHTNETFLINHKHHRIRRDSNQTITTTTQNSTSSTATSRPKKARRKISPASSSDAATSAHHRQHKKRQYYITAPTTYVQCWPVYVTPGAPGAPPPTLRDCTPCWSNCVDRRGPAVVSSTRRPGGGVHPPPASRGRHPPAAGTPRVRPSQPPPPGGRPVITVTTRRKPPPPASQRNRHRYKDRARGWVGLKYGCGCNLHGSELATCDIVTGKCRCKPHVIGRICDRCEYGFWNIKSNRGCAPCDCDVIGSVNKTCHIETGQCFCKPGVGGLRCDTCLDRYYEFSESGCKECEYCVKPGHVCDPDTGRCVCPPFSHGEICNKCIPNAWGFEPHRGCKPCHCDSIGSFRSQCDPFTGQCSCRDGYTGNRCNKCSPGFYGFPRCRRCNCNLQGTSEQSCDVLTGICSCNDQGFCDCKANVLGKKCDTCKDGTFGLEKNNPEGCTPCFCFGRSTRCTQAGLTWGQIRLKNSRQLQIEKVLPPRRPTNNIAYISHIKFKKPTYGNLYSPKNNIEIYPIDASYLNSTKGLMIIPETDGNITIGAYEPFQTPLYWKLPDTFYGDRVVSYGGYLQFKTFTETNNVNRNFPQAVLNKYPLVLIKGNGITLAHYPLFHGKYEIRFHESLWSVFHGVDVPFNFRETRVTRNLLMIVLQNVQEILIRATDVEFYTKAVLLDATMDTAILVSGQPPPLAKGVELCDCPKQYNASSCQNPSIGFYRHYPNRTIQIDGTIIIDTSGSDITSIIGDVVPCSCNGRSTTCDIETGFCTNCEKHTSGSYCDVCAEGYYGHPDHGDGCLPCPCPTSVHNFARGCHQDAVTGAFRCVCKEGYAGRHCEDCSVGYYRNPLTGTCDSCHCHIYGRASEECDQVTGQCNCKPGFNGTDCSKCEAYRHILDHNRCVPADDCTLQLLDKLDEMNAELDRNTEQIKDGKVPAPYPILQQIERTVNEKAYEIEQIQTAATKIFHFPLKSLKDLVKRMKLYEKNVQMLEHEAYNASIKATHVRKKSEKLQKKIQHINTSLHESVQMLNRFIASDRHVNIKKAVRTGYHLLEQINNVDFTNELNEVTLILYDCEQLLKKLTKINNDLNDFTNRYDDIRQIIDNTIDKIADVERRNRENRVALNDLNNKTDVIDNQKMNIEDVLGDNNYLKRLQNLINDLETVYNDLQNGITDLQDLTLDLNRSQLDASQVDALQEQVRAASDHAEYLTQLADSYEDKFKLTRDKAVKSVEASQVYKNIRNSLYEAYEAAKNASRTVDSVNMFLYPEYEKSLSDRTAEVLANSNRIKHMAETQKHRVDKLRDRQLHLNLTIDSVKDTLWTTGVQDNNISKTLTEFNSSITHSMEMVLQEVNKISNDMKNLYNRAKQIQDDKAYKLLPTLHDLTATQGNISVYFSSIEEKLTETQTSKDNLEARLQSINIVAMNQRDIFNRWNNSLVDKLQTLKNKVDQARRLASEVQIPLTSKEQFRCTRVYRPYTMPMGNSTATTISFVLSLVYDIQNSPLIYIGGANNHFIAVEMVNRKIRLLWQLGDDVGIVVHPEPIEKLTENSGYYYSVQIERIRNIGTLNVRKKFLSNGTTVSSDDWRPPETKTTNPKYTILNSGAVNDVWVGGIPNRATEMYPDLLKSQGLAVSIYDLVLNENPIGLWNYHETEKSACQSDTYWTYTLNEYQFNGAGYSVKEIKNQFASLRMSITLTFKTFDADALIIAVVSPKNNSFLSISLEDGHLVYFVQYVGESVLKIKTDEKYNTGKPIRIEGSREFNRKKQENAILKINNQKIYRSNPDIPVTKNQLPDLKMAKYYLGGLSPFLIHNMRYMVSTFREYQSMLGCMFEIQVDQKRIDPVDAEHDGVEYSCSERTLNRVGFLGDGYIKIGLPAINKIQSFSFIFNTQRENGLLALVTLNMEQSKDTSYILVRLKAGQIECEIRQGKLTNILLTNENYNDGMTHVFSLNKEQKHMELRMDDELKDHLGHKLQGYADIIYFGGYPNKVLGDVVINEPTFEGTIQDVIINNELILFNSPLAFERVRIGRDGPKYSKVSPLEVAIAPLSMSTLDEEACNNKYTNLTYERGALKLGDAPYSHVQHPLNIADFWKKNFRLEFEFRTFYPNGMLFVSPGLQKGKQRHHILLQIKNGTVYLSIKGRRKRELHLPIEVSDGMWHRVQIQSTNMKWTLSIDNMTSHAQKRPKKLNVANKIYVGAWPEYENRLPASLVQDLQTFKGCVRRLQINGHLRDLTSNKTNDAIHNTGECFPQIERGSYFNGQAYAIYRKNFQLPTSFEFSLEFKTSQLNGILLTSGGSNNPPLLSLELNNGRVILSAQINYEKPVHVDVALPSPYDICNNKWHLIRGFYSENEPIVIKIDDITSTPSYVSLGEVNNQIRVNLESALYIGGLPESVPSGTLQTRENFHGCLRNIVIGNKQRDWLDMDELQNVLLNSCPII